MLPHTTALGCSPQRRDCVPSHELFRIESGNNSTGSTRSVVSDEQSTVSQDECPTGKQKVKINNHEGMKNTKKKLIKPFVAFVFFVVRFLGQKRGRYKTYPYIIPFGYEIQYFTF